MLLNEPLEGPRDGGQGLRVVTRPSAPNPSLRFGRSLTLQNGNFFITDCKRGWGLV